MRRFASTAASRHIPKCKDTVNKPKPPPGLRGGPMGGAANSRNSQPVPVARSTGKRYA